MLFNLLISVFLSMTIVFFSYKKRSLSKSGAVTAFFVGTIHTMAHFSFNVALLSFFISSSLLTRLKGDKKKLLDADYKKGGQRNWKQVLSNAGVPTLYCILYMYFFGFDHVISTDRTGGIQAYYFAMLIYGVYFCTNGDTWASEVGILSESDPKLITNCKRVPKGTNGGVSVLGLTASAIGGLFVSSSVWVTTLIGGVQLPFEFLLIGAMGGFMGSLVDSVLGATLQFSGWDSKLQKVVNVKGENTVKLNHVNLDLLDNNQVNLMASVLTSFFIYAMAYALTY
eukprot:TRINITY_DN13446_c0_g1_i1.p1 TRINITY_DN13446_c0_g1~~TRINITY_DN13446_c0_g1_i1.p1  ORF type:complete len:298 (+),score=35.47 TRINITY_DN13446_c0_g1_i1:48-896(+)